MVFFVCLLTYANIAKSNRNKHNCYVSSITAQSTRFFFKGNVENATFVINYSAIYGWKGNVHTSKHYEQALAATRETILPRRPSKKKLAKISEIHACATLYPLTSSTALIYFCYGCRACECVDESFLTFGVTFLPVAFVCFLNECWLECYCQLVRKCWVHKMS